MKPNINVFRYSRISITLRKDYTSFSNEVRVYKLAFSKFMPFYNDAQEMHTSIRNFQSGMPF